MSDVKEKQHVRATIQLVSPELAKSWLEHNTKNRNLREHHVAELLQAMRNGEWEVSTDAIGFDTDGVLNNGQHRLAALIKYGKPLEFLVAKNMSTDAFNIIDTNKTRSATDVLGVENFTYPAIRTGIIRFMMRYNSGESVNTSIKGGGKKLTNPTILDFAQKHVEKLDECIEIARIATNKFRPLENRFIGSLYWIFAKKDPEMAKMFFEYYGTGEGLTPNDPILLLRGKLIQDMASTKKVSVEEKLAWVCLAWNYIRSGKKIKQLKWDAKAVFPVPI